ncbi:MAG: hypothetical protein AAF632_27970 [Bacteroidota bacterium]
MVKLSSKITAAFIIATTIFSLPVTKAQSLRGSTLFKTLKTKDSLLFNVGFNQCNLAQVESLLAQDFEFYHDKEGITSSTDSFITSLKKSHCHSARNHALRVLVDESLEIFPLHSQGELYGALQTGNHSFGGTTARFMHLWLLENEAWVLSRILSYDHQPNQSITALDTANVTLSPDSLSSYLGDYSFSPDFVLSIVLEDNALYGDAKGQKVQIDPIGNHQFIDESKQMKLYFIVSAEGNVTGLKMISSNGEMIAHKVD